MIFTYINEEEYDEFGLKKIYREGLHKYSDMPQIGDIIRGKVSSVQPYGFFINLIEKHDRRRRYWISGLLHKSNINKNHPFSILNPELEKRGLTPLKRKITVEIIDFTEKGYVLKETLPKLIPSDKRISKKDCKTMMYSRVEAILVSIEKNVKITQWKPTKEISIQRCNNIILCNNATYYKIETVGRNNIYITQDYKAITEDYSMKFIKFHDKVNLLPYDYFNPNIKLEDWRENQSIVDYNQDLHDEYYKKIEIRENQKRYWEENKKKKESFIKILEKNHPIAIYNMYLSDIERIRYGRKMRDRDHISREHYEETPENIVKVEVFAYQNRKYYKIDGSWEKLIKIKSYSSMDFISCASFSMNDKTLIVNWYTDFYYYQFTSTAV